MDEDKVASKTIAAAVKFADAMTGPQLQAAVDRGHRERTAATRCMEIGTDAALAEAQAKDDAGASRGLVGTGDIKSVLAEDQVAVAQGSIFTDAERAACKCQTAKVETESDARYARVVALTEKLFMMSVEMWLSRAADNDMLDDNDHVRVDGLTNAFTKLSTMAITASRAYAERVWGYRFDTPIDTSIKR